MKTEYNNRQHRGYDWATAGVGVGMGLVNDAQKLLFGKAFQNQQLDGQKRALEQQNAASMDIWNKTNYGAQIRQMKGAGLNPAMVYGMGGGGGSTGSSSAMPAPSGESKGMDIMSAAQLRLMNAQAKKLEAEARAAGSGAAMSEIDAVIKGMDFQDYYANEEDINGFEIGENQQRKSRRESVYRQQEAAKGVAMNLAEQFKNGNLAKMSQAELDSKLEEIGVRKGTVKKLELENALTEMEKRLMEQLGMGKDAKGWIDSGMKVILLLISKAIKQR